MEIKAFCIGVRDGFNQPHDLTSGMSYATIEKNEAYDTGVNYGQWFGRILGEVRRGPGYNQMRCRYYDCSNGYEVARHNEAVTCPKCRKNLGMD